MITSVGHKEIRVLEIVPKLITAGGQRLALDLAQYLDAQRFQVEIVSLYPFSGEPFELQAKHSVVWLYFYTWNCDLLIIRHYLNRDIEHQ
jgi:hypothetical protein